MNTRRGFIGGLLAGAASVGGVFRSASKPEPVEVEVTATMEEIRRILHEICEQTRHMAELEERVDRLEKPTATFTAWTTA